MEPGIELLAIRAQQEPRGQPTKPVRVATDIEHWGRGRIGMLDLAEPKYHLGLVEPYRVWLRHPAIGDSEFEREVAAKADVLGRSPALRGNVVFGTAVGLPRFERIEESTLDLATGCRIVVGVDEKRKWFVTFGVRFFHEDKVELNARDHVRCD